MQVTHSDPAGADRMFRAFSDRTRLRILCLLREGELCVGDLVTVLRVPQPAASRHLAYLRRSSLVVARKEGAWMFYALAAPCSRLHARLLDCLRACRRTVPEITRDEKRLRRLVREGGCCPE